MALEDCLVEFFALQARRAGNVLTVSHNETIKKYEKWLPITLLNYMNSKYEGSLVRFFSAHTDSFVFISKNKVWLQPHFDSVSLLMNPRNMDIVQFFLDLLQKLGATRKQPCSARILSKYIQYMDHDARLFLHKMYANSLNIFFALNLSHFHATSPDRCFVSLRRPVEASNCVAAHLRKCLHKSRAFNQASGLSMEQLQHEGSATWLPDLRLYFSNGARTKLNHVLNSYPNIFKWKPYEKVWLRKKYGKWKDVWSDTEELLLTIHFMELLKDIGAVQSNPICFNYILCSTDSVPQECSAYLTTVFPGIDLIDLFHLHPDKFDLSTVNCVSLKCGTDEVETKRGPELLSAYYAAQLLKYAPNLTPDLFSICTEHATKAVKTYCASTVRHRLHTVLDSGRELLASGGIDRRKPIDMIKSICGTPASRVTKDNGSRKSNCSSSKHPISVTEKACTKLFSKAEQAPILASTTETEHNAPNVQMPITSLPVSACGSLTLSETMKPQDRWVKPGSQGKLKENAARPGTLVRSHSLVVISTSYSVNLQSQDASPGEYCVPKLKTDSIKSASMRRSNSLACLALNNSAHPAALWVANSAEAQKKLSSVQPAGNAAEILSPSTVPETSNSSAKCSKQELIIMTDKNAEIGDFPDLSSDYVYSKMESELSEFIEKRLEGNPTHSENFTSLHEAVKKIFGAVCSHEIHLAVLFCVGTLSFDGKNIHYHPN
uniref:Uncharacterized protein n=1 Tax=Rhipicephalus zambeziensis TaxID=60191 RepID=A0A224YAG7_9ACAR